MKPFYKWSAVGILLVLAALSANKGMDLWSLGTDVGGAGIGVYFLSFEINDRVAEGSIPAYAIGFFIASGVLALASLAIVIKSLYQHNSKKNFKNA